MIIQLTRGFSSKIDDDDHALVARYKWCASGKDEKPYAMTNSSQKNGERRRVILMHRLIMAPSPGLVVDHIDGDTLNNSRRNLRVCEHRENIAASRSRTGISQFKGVTFDKARSKWVAQIKVDYAHRFLGRFEDEQSAALAYDTAAVSAWGQFAVTNFPQSKLLSP